MDFNIAMLLDMDIMEMTSKRFAARPIKMHVTIFNQVSNGNQVPTRLDDSDDHGKIRQTAEKKLNNIFLSR